MKNLIFLSLLLAGSISFAQDEAPLDPPYNYPQKTYVRERKLDTSRMTRNSRLPRNDVDAVIAEQSPVRSQGSRGTCSIFSATAALEGQMIAAGFADQTVDLSEQWLEYTVNRWNRFGGSNSPKNFAAFEKYGTTPEALYAYNSMEWKTLTDSPDATAACGKVPENFQVYCLAVQRDPRLLDVREDALFLNEESEYFDPEFLAAWKEARTFKRNVMTFAERESYMDHLRVRELLQQGLPVTVGMDFYYGTWNHRVSGELGINRNMEHWSQGLVGFPEPGSVDYARSPEKRAGHSVLLVGYDDDVEIVTQVLMEDGSTKEFTYKGVYYFKNSWGTSGFGAVARINGILRPGYGVMTQKYAEHYGSFFSLKLNRP